MATTDIDALVRALTVAHPDSGVMGTIRRSGIAMSGTVVDPSPRERHAGGSTLPRLAVDEGGGSGAARADLEIVALLGRGGMARWLWRARSRTACWRWRAIREHRHRERPWRGPMSG